MKAILIGAGTVIMVILIVSFANSYGNANDRTTDPSSVPITDIQAVGGSAEDVVDLHYALNPGDRAETCEALGLVGYDLAFDAFALGYVAPDPSATEVFDEVVSRC